MEKMSLKYGSKKIIYNLIRNDRKTLAIIVTPELKVIIKAPVSASIAKIETALKKRALWILKQQNFFLAYYPKETPKKYISGETHLYLGRHYRLKINNGKSESVKINGKFINVVCTDKSRVKNILETCYGKQASEKLLYYYSEICQLLKKYNITPAGIQLREMTMRWGSCTQRNKIILNRNLIKAPRGCIEYVIIHELCHIKYKNHNHKFMELQKSLMPNWEKWKDRLEKMLA